VQLFFATLSQLAASHPVLMKNIQDEGCLEKERRSSPLCRSPPSTMAGNCLAGTVRACLKIPFSS
jgi:hypothetical protein